MPITASKTIEILEINVKEASKQMPPDVKDALNLSIVAWKAIQMIRKGTTVDLLSPLLGEAPER